MPKFIDLTGQKFGRLTVIRRTDRRPRAWWLCACDCGETKEISNENLRRKHATSCGCLVREIAKTLGLARRKHINGWKPSPEQSTWKSMISRCYCESHSSYKFYGGRGVKVSDEWRGRDGYKRWLEYMGTKPSPLHSIDRINTWGDYEPGNCRWAIKPVQVRNTKSNVNISIAGVTMCAKDWAAKNGLPYTTVLGRIERGWNHQDAVSRPVGGSA